MEQRLILLIQEPLRLLLLTRNLRSIVLRLRVIIFSLSNTIKFIILSRSIQLGLMKKKFKLFGLFTFLRNIDDNFEYLCTKVHSNCKLPLNWYTWSLQDTARTYSRFELITLASRIQSSRDRGLRKYIPAVANFCLFSKYKFQ